METYWDARMDLLQRNISRRKDKLKMRAEVALNEILKGKPASPEVLAENFEREVARLKLKVCCLEDRSCQLPSVCRSPSVWYRCPRRGNLRMWSELARKLVSSSESCP